MGHTFSRDVRGGGGDAAAPLADEAGMGHEVEAGRDGAAAGGPDVMGYNAVSNRNFGMGASLWGAAASPPLPPRRHPAGPHSPVAGSDDFPVIPPRLTLATLLSDGLQADLVWQPYQLPRLGPSWASAAAAAAAARDEEAAALAQPKERDTIRCKNALKLFKKTLALEALPVASAVDDAAASSASVARAPSGVSTRFGLRFAFECLVPCQVQVHWLANEIDSVVAGGINFAQNAAAAAVPASAASGAGGAPSPAAPLVPPQHFPAGRHEYTLPAQYALDIANLSDLQLLHSTRLKYYPLIIHFVEQADGRAEAGEAKEDSNSSSSSVGSSSSVLSGSSSGVPRVRSLSCFCSLARRSGASGISAKLVAQAVILAPSGQRYNIQELYSGAGDEGKEGAAGNKSASPEEPRIAASSAVGGVYASIPGRASPSSHGVGECVVCLVETKDTAILPCRHMCLCHDCSLIVKRQTPPRCPVCRAHVEGTVRITLPPVEGRAAQA